jgi:hypothetical protein
MNTKKYILASALPLTVGLTMFAMLANAQPPAASANHERAKARLTEASENRARVSTEKAREIKAAYDARRTAELVRPARMCHVFMTVDWIPPGPSPHLRIDDVVLLVGPLPYSGAYQVTPVGGLGRFPGWDHPWKQGHYFALPIDNPSQPNVYALHGVMVAPHGGDDEREHEYTMEVTDMENNCPSYAIISGACHVGSLCPADPGHAGVTK